MRTSIQITVVTVLAAALLLLSARVPWSGGIHLVPVPWTVGF